MNMALAAVGAKASTTLLTEKFDRPNDDCKDSGYVDRDRDLWLLSHEDILHRQERPEPVTGVAAQLAVVTYSAWSIGLALWARPESKAR